MTLGGPVETHFLNSYLLRMYASKSTGDVCSVGFCAWLAEGVRESMAGPAAAAEPSRPPYGEIAKLD